MQMDISKDNTKLTVKLEGKFDATTADGLKAELTEKLEGITELVIDMAELKYISSSGIRVLLFAQKKMNQQGKMIIKNVNDSVREIFSITGVIDIITIE